MTDDLSVSALIKAISSSSQLSETNKRRILNVLNEENLEYGKDEQGRLKVAMFDAKTYDKNAFEKACPDNIKIIAHDAALDEKTAVLAKGCKVVCIFVNDKCDEKAIKVLAKYGVEFIALRCAGFNNVDLAACQAHAIDVVRVPAYSPHAVAEHTVALMLMLNRNLHKAYLRNRSGQFLLDGLVGFDMYGKTVGVVGTGKIGKCVIDILCGFGCKIKAYDLFPDPSLAKKENLEYVELDELLQTSKIISLHAPLSAENKYLINKKSIDKMQDGVMLINTSRGALIDSKALIYGLKSGKIAKAGLDVYEEESEIFFKDKSDLVIDDDVFARLMSFNNVVITSHQAFLTDEALNNIAQSTFDNIAEYLSGKKSSALSNIVSA